MENQITHNQITSDIQRPLEGQVIVEPQAAPLIRKVVRDLGDKISHDKLLSCLYFILDAMDRAGLDFFLIRQTAKDAMQSPFNGLTGDHIDIGVRLNEWNNDQKDILFTYLDQERVNVVKEEPSFLDLTWQDIPFTIHLYEDNPCITALNTVAYQYESWHIPNMFERFEKEYDH